MTRCIIYARFSPRRNAKDCESIAMQLEACRRYARSQKWEIAGTYEDPEVSGKEEDRPALWQAVGAVKRGDILLVWKLDRLARSAYLSFHLERIITKRRARIVSATGEGTWEDTAEGRLIRRILQANAEYERELIGARTRAAVLRHQANGRRMSSIAPFGWKVHPEDPKRLLPVREEQGIIRRVTEMRKEGSGPRQIARRLREEGHKCRGERFWHHTLIRNILRRAQAAAQGEP